jgi:hypothetical protein
MRELTDPELALCRKDKGRAVELKAQGNACFSKKEFRQALGFYSQVCLLISFKWVVGLCHSNLMIRGNGMSNGVNGVVLVEISKSQLRRGNEVIYFFFFLQTK